MENQKPEALRLAEWCEENSPSIYRQSAETATELRRQHARIQELEAMLESVGAGGVSAQRIRQGSDHIAQDLKMVAAPMVLPEPVAVQIRHIKEERWRTIAIVLYDLFAGGEYERRYIYTEQQVRELLAGVSAPAAQAINLLAADHSGMKVDYRGLLSQVQSAIKQSDPGYAEMLRQLEGHLQELGQRWYAGDTNVVDEILQLYCIERDSRKTVRQDAAAIAAAKGE
jgi:hypothetical protein